MTIATRRKAREIAFLTIYQREKIGISTEGEVLLIKNEKLHKKHKHFMKQLICVTWNHLEEIDKKIQEKLENWRQSRLNSSLNALLRIGVCELILMKETEGKVVINECIEICKKYVGESAVKLCNGVLNAVWKDLIDNFEK